MIVKSLYTQSIQDLCLSYYNSLDNLYSILLDNDLNLESIIDVGDMIILRDELIVSSNKFINDSDLELEINDTPIPITVDEPSEIIIKKQIKVLYSQSIQDLCLSYYNSLDNLYSILLDNNLNYNSIVSIGDKIILNENLIVNSNKFVNNIGETFVSDYLLLKSFDSTYSFGVCLDSDNNLYITNSTLNTLIKIDQDSNLLLTITGLNNPYGVCLDSDNNNIYIANKGGNSIKKYDNTGNLLLTITTNVVAPFGVAIDSSNNIWVCNNIGTFPSPNQNKITKYNSSGSLLQTITSGINYPSGITIDSDDNVYISNGYDNKITKYNSSGSLIQTISGDMLSPFGVSLDSDNNIYVANNSNDTITVYSPDGTLIKTITGFFAVPSGIDLDSDNNIYVSNFYGDNVNCIGYKTYTEVILEENSSPNYITVGDYSKEDIDTTFLKYKVRFDQTIEDICVQFTNSLSDLFTILQDNNLNYDSVLSTGQILNIRYSLITNNKIIVNDSELNLEENGAYLIDDLNNIFVDELGNKFIIF